MKYVYYTNCVNWPRDDVSCSGGLMDMIDSPSERQVTRRTFLSRVDKDQLAELEEELSYERHPSRGLTMAGDWHVSYHRSVLHGQTVYYFKHSGIEYVFVSEDYHE